MAKTLEQKRAALAWDKVKEIEGKDETLQKEYRSAVLKAPAMIMTNGLGPTLAFLRSRKEGNKEKAEDILHKHISAWLKSPDAPISWTSTKDDIMERIVEEDSIVYRQATQEALMFITWLKRFAQARLKGGTP